MRDPDRFASRRAPLWRALLAGVAMPAAASGLGWALGATTTTAGMLYVLAVVAAAWLAGIRSGLLASALSFLGLNYLFTPPLYTFRVESGDDLAALAVFLVVAFLIGSLLARAVGQRDRAERREEQARVLYGLLSRLRFRESIERAIEAIVADVATAFAVDDVRIRVIEPDLTRTARTGDDGWEPAFAVPLRAGERELGSLETRRAPHDEDDVALLRAFAGQLALAVESARLDESARRAEVDAEASGVRAALFGSVTHDLRTPLASIKASVTSLLDEAVPFDTGQRRELLRTILEETDRLNRLVGNLLDLSRIRTGALVAAKVPVEAGELVDGVVARMRGLLGDRRVELRLREDLPEVWVDPIQVDQVLTNLIENAVRFSPAGSPIAISVARWRDGVQIRVIDRGGGIPPEERERVFEAFARGEGAGPGSTGLGLAIARAVVGLHGGRIWIEETPGGGTTLVFELPAGAPVGT